MARNDSRIEAARRRVRIARHSIVVGAATAFALVGFAARDAHPATHSTSSTTAPASDSTQASTFGFDGGGSISPSFDAPSVQSGGS